MLEVHGRGSRLCDGISRRTLLQAGALSTLGLSLPQLLRQQADAAETTGGAAKAVILINLIGGPSHIDMFDMKPNAPADVRGEFQSIDTSVPGLQISEHLPLTARTMHHSSLIRTHTHLYNTHSPYNMLTGYSGPVIVNNVAKPTDHPSIGAVMQHAGLRSRDVPTYVWMPSHPGHSQTKHRAGPYGGFLGSTYDPMFTAYDPKFEGDTSARDAHINPAIPIAQPRLPLIDEMPDIELDRLDRRRSLLEQFDKQIARFDASRSTDSKTCWTRSSAMPT